MWRAVQEVFELRLVLALASHFTFCQPRKSGIQCNAHMGTHWAYIAAKGVLTTYNGELGAKINSVSAAWCPQQYYVVYVFTKIEHEVRLTFNRADTLSSPQWTHQTSYLTAEKLHKPTDIAALCLSQPHSISFSQPPLMRCPTQCVTPFTHLAIPQLSRESNLHVYIGC